MVDDDFIDSCTIQEMQEVIKFEHTLPHPVEYEMY